MSWETVEQRPWYQDKRLWIGCGVAVGLVLLALPHLQRAVREWRSRRYIARAETASARGDLDAAMLNARAALSLNAKNVEAFRVMAKSLEKVHSPSALQVRRQIDALAPGDSENLLGMARDCLQNGDTEAAELALSRIKPADRPHAAYYDVAGGIFAQEGQYGRADEALTEALKLEPGNEDLQIKLAGLRLRSKDSNARAEALANLTRLSESSPKKLVALRTLLNDATRRDETERAKTLADAIAADPKATFSERLARLTALRLRRAGPFSSFSNMEAKQEFFAALAEMQQAAGTRTEDVYALVNWMNENDLALLAPDWEATLPPSLTGQPPVCIAMAEAFARGSAWAPLKKRLEKASWGESDYLRLAYLARSRERLKEAGDDALWQQAVAGAHGKGKRLEVLARFALACEWEKRAASVLWQLAVTDQPPRWALDRLWALAQKSGDSEQLYRAAKVLLQADPKNVGARNSFTILCLLTGRELESSFQLAASLAKENPGNELVADTYGLALYLQGKPAEAVRVMEELTPAQLETPSVALYYGVFLAANGQWDKAGKYLELGGQANRLPEEVALSEHLRLALAAREAELRSDRQAADEAWKGAVAAAQDRPDTLETLGRMAGEWKWTDRVEKVALRLAQLDRCPLWAREPLWAAALRGGDSAQMYQAARLIWHADRSNAPARDRFILLSVLTRHEADEPRRLAETLRKASPDDVEIAAAYGFILMEDGKAEDAVSQMKRLKPEPLREPRASLYQGIFMAAAGQTEKAEAYLKAGTPGVQFPEEKALLDLLTLAARARAMEERQAGSGGAGWDEALAAAQSRAYWVEMLARMALAWGWTGRAEQALWKVANTKNCPRWALEFLCHEAERQRDSGRFYEAGKLLALADPGNLQARNRFVYLSLLTHQQQDFPYRSAESVFHDHPTDSEAVTNFGLALFDQGRTKEAVGALSALKPEQLREPKPALYYGVFLAAAGQLKEAEKYLDAGAAAARLPEEQALAAKARAAASPRAPL